MMSKCTGLVGGCFGGLVCALGVVVHTRGWTKGVLGGAFSSLPSELFGFTFDGFLHVGGGQRGLELHSEAKFDIGTRAGHRLGAILNEGLNGFGDFALVHQRLWKKKSSKFNFTRKNI